MSPMRKHPVTEWRENQRPPVSIKELSRRSGWPHAGVTDVCIGDIERGAANCGGKAALVLERLTGIPIRTLLEWKPDPPEARE